MLAPLRLIGGLVSSLFFGSAGDAADGPATDGVVAAVAAAAAAA